MHDLLVEYHKTKSIAIRNEIVMENARLAYKLAGQFYRRFKGRVPLDDLISECFIGMIRAIENFNPELGFGFAALACPTIRWHVMHYIERYEMNHSKFRYVSYCRRNDKGLEQSELIADEAGIDPQVWAAGNELTQKLMAKLNPKYQRILGHLMDGWSDTEASAAESLGRGNGRLVRQAAAKHLKRLRGGLD